MGYFTPDQWVNLSRNKCNVIAITLLYIANGRLIEVMQTLLYEWFIAGNIALILPAEAINKIKEWSFKMMGVEV